MFDWILSMMIGALIMPQPPAAMMVVTSWQFCFCYRSVKV
jgi:hypothetical protein